MGLVRAFSDLGQVIIRKLGDTGGPRADRVSAEFDNIINWAKASPRRIRFDTSAVGNVGAGLDVLHTFSLDTPNRLNTDGDELEMFYGGFFAANDTDKRVNLFFGGTGYENIGVLDIDSSGWRAHVNVLRLSSTSVRISHTLTYFGFHADSATPPAVQAFAVGFLSITRNTDIGGLANLNSNATTIEVKGEGAANNDVVQNFSIIRLTQQ